MKKIIALSAALLFAVPAFAQLSSSQMATLKATCTADRTCAALATAADDVGLAAWFNAANPYRMCRLAV